MLQFVKSLHTCTYISSGGRIDHAHHDTRAHRASVETWAMSDAVQKALDMTNQDDTLIVVSADHSHVVTSNGYPHMDSPIYGGCFKLIRIGRLLRVYIYLI